MLIWILASNDKAVWSVDLALAWDSAHSVTNCAAQGGPLHLSGFFFLLGEMKTWNSNL